MHLKAIEAHLRTRGELPLNLKLIVEGEEEIGSVHFEELITGERHRLTADVCIVSDTAMHSRGRPSLIIGLRGGAALEMVISGPSTDLHSGTFGGAVLNPIHALVAMLASLHDPATGRVTVPGFYDDVVELSARERAEIAAIPFEEDDFRRNAGDVRELRGESGYNARERTTTRPTLEINGIWGGHRGAGTKTIVPARAGAKISCRLVPEQRPDDIGAKVRAALEASAPSAVNVDVTLGGRVNPVTTPAEHPAIAVAAQALRDVFGSEPLLLRSGGSIAPVEMFARLMAVPTVLLGVGLPDDRIHAPNEKFDLDQYHAGVRVMARLWDGLAAALPGASNF
jgi:acetylornithine deacetylase/succinyl-diaminopimelate desuccinylase-like protein